MGLLGWRGFSSIPNLFRKVRQRTRQREKVATQISSDFLQFVINNGLRIREAGSVSNGTNVLYTVPTGKVFYLVSCTLHWINSAAITTREAVMVLSNRSIIDIKPSLTDEDFGSLSLGFSVPVLMVEGENLDVRSGDAGCEVLGTIQGYELDVKEEKQRF